MLSVAVGTYNVIYLMSHSAHYVTIAIEPPNSKRPAKVVTPNYRRLALQLGNYPPPPPGPPRMRIPRWQGKVSHLTFAELTH